MVASSGDRDDGAAARCPARDRAAGVTPPAKPSRFPFGFPTMLQVRQRGRAWAKPLGRFGPASGVGANFNFAGSSAEGPQRSVSGHRARRAKPRPPRRAFQAACRAVPDGWPTASSTTTSKAFLPAADVERFGFEPRLSGERQGARRPLRKKRRTGRVRDR
jgi:hypothetical protein